MMIKYPAKYIDIITNNDISIDEFNEAMSNHADKIYGRRLGIDKIASYLEHLRDEKQELFKKNKQNIPRKVVEYNNHRIDEINKIIAKYDGVVPLSFNEAFPNEKNDHN
jgi:hypothetical protein